MLIKNLFIVLSLASIAGTMITNGAVISNQEKEKGKIRNLDQYEKAGPYDAGVYMENYDTTMQRLREFLWKQWTRKRQGYIVTVLYTKEGDTITSHYFVEPDEVGKWHIAIRNERKLLDRANWAKTKEIKYYNEVDESKAYFLERIRTDNLRNKSVKLPDNEDRPSDTWLLRLKDLNKKWLINL